MFDLSPMMDDRPVYLDYNATTPCAPEVVSAMLPFLESDFANASSVHLMGRRAAAAVVDAREAVSRCIGCDCGEIFFTSGATESNNIVLFGIANRKPRRHRIVVTAIEHKSVLEPCSWLAENGFEVVQIPVTSDGVTDVDAARKLIDDKTVVVCVQGANNEIGTLQPVADIARIAHGHGALVHCDATQMLGKVKVSITDLGVDFASFSGHKVYGPKGVGLLFAQRGSAMSLVEPIYRGGGQEAGIRPGTTNVPAIVGLGVACSLSNGSLSEDAGRITMLRDLLERQLVESCLDAFVIGSEAERLPGTTSLCFNDVPGDLLLARTPLVCAGIGSACTAGATEPSHVLLACGLPRDVARCTVRLSLGRYTTQEEVEYAATHLSKNVNEIRSSLSRHN